MSRVFLATVLLLVSSLALLLVLALYRHKRNSAGDVRLIGEVGKAETTLNPEGTVMVHGEMWRARSRDGAVIASSTRVRVVAVEGHLALVDACE